MNGKKLLIIGLAIAVVLSLAIPIYTMYASADEGEKTFQVSVTMVGRSNDGAIETRGEFTLTLEGSRGNWNIYRVTSGQLTITSDSGEITVNIAKGVLATQRHRHALRAKLMLEGDGAHGGLILRGFWAKGDSEGEYHGYFLYGFRISHLKGMGSGEAVAVRG